MYLSLSLATKGVKCSCSILYNTLKKTKTTLGIRFIVSTEKILLLNVLKNILLYYNPVNFNSPCFYSFKIFADKSVD